MTRHFAQIVEAVRKLTLGAVATVAIDVPRMTQLGLVALRERRLCVLLLLLLHLLLVQLLLMQRELRRRRTRRLGRARIVGSGQR